MTERAHLTIGEITGPGNCTMGSCTVDWDREHRCWRADLHCMIDEPPLRAWSQSSKAAVLAVFAKWLGVEDELRETMAPRGWSQQEWREYLGRGSMPV